MSQINQVLAFIAAAALPELIEVYSKPILTNDQGLPQLPLPTRQGIQITREEAIRDAAVMFIAWPSVIDMYGIKGTEVLAEVTRLKNEKTKANPFTAALLKDSPVG